MQSASEHEPPPSDAPPLQAKPDPAQALLALRLRIGRAFRLQYEPAQNAHVLLYPEGMVRLNPSAGEILRRCDGQRTLAAVIEDLEAAYALPGLAPAVIGFVEVALKQRWVEPA